MVRKHNNSLTTRADNESSRSSEAADASMGVLAWSQKMIFFSLLTNPRINLRIWLQVHSSGPFRILTLIIESEISEGPLEWNLYLSGPEIVLRSELPSFQKLNRHFLQAEDRHLARNCHYFN